MVSIVSSADARVSISSADSALVRDFSRVWSIRAAISRPAAAFAELDAGNRYSIIWRVNEAKRPQTRQRRIATYLDMLRRGERIHR
ncbi:YdeI/OmpD-associated family protein [Nocardia sp. NBC_01503]|uniref:YdeI/OmpD-associated family protein n=1 Tax=Nocardia sp. NBC_01503 TaxID=2975997 RepID=UPI002E7B9E9F|nr:YdeI/OmpD-associated family protein [Nocardia sp. NBC_01503]WTL32556.1 YdeI/OmpD-associated family protein [Nocardia sp. NBC_01503]